MSPADLFMAVYPGGSDKFKADAKKSPVRMALIAHVVKCQVALAPKHSQGVTCNQEQSLKKFYGLFIGVSQVCIRIKELAADLDDNLGGNLGALIL